MEGESTVFADGGFEGWSIELCVEGEWVLYEWKDEMFWNLVFLKKLTPSLSSRGISTWIKSQNGTLQSNRTDILEGFLHSLESRQ